MTTPTMPKATPLFVRAPRPGAASVPAPELPMSRAEMDQLGWDECDVDLVTGDAYIDHPSFGMAVVGRALERAGFRVGIIAQPDWHSAEPFARAGPAAPVLRRDGRQHGLDGQPLHVQPPHPQGRRLHAGRRGRTGGPTAPCWSTRSAAARRSRTCRSSSGGIEASLRRIAHYDYWSDKVQAQSCCRTPRPICWCTATASGRSSRSPTAWTPARTCAQMTDIRGTAFMRSGRARPDSSSWTRPSWTAPAR